MPFTAGSLAEPQARAAAYVEQNGTTLERATLRYFLWGEEPAPEVLAGLASLQNGDGGFPYDMQPGRLSTVNHTQVALWWLDDLGRLDSEPAGRAFGYLLATQGPDGAWDEAKAILRYKPPPWMEPGHPKAREYLTAYSAYWLALGGYRENPAFQRAIAYLLGRRDASGRLRGFAHSRWITAAVFLLGRPHFAKEAQALLTALAEVPWSVWEPSQLAWALDCLSRAGLPASDPFLSDGLAELAARQAPDGSWASEDGPAFAVGATVQALKVLLRHAG